MNRREYIEYELEENAKKSKKLKEEYHTKDTEYINAIEEFKNSETNSDIEEKKQFLHTLQEKHKKELDELKLRHKLERESAQWDYDESKEDKSSALDILRIERSEIIRKLSDINIKSKELKAEKKKLIKLNQVYISSHSMVQYLDRARGVDILSIKKEITDKSEDKKLSEIQDHEIIDFLSKENRIVIEEIEDEMVPENIKKTILSDELLGISGTFKRKDGFRLVVKNSTIITFLPKEAKIKKKGSYYGLKKEKKKIRKMRL